MICGDFNLHVDSAQCTDAAKLQHLLDSFNCKQHVTQPTHRDGHTLDLVITRTDTDVAELTVGDMVSDHQLILFKVSVTQPPPVFRQRQCRKWSQMNEEQFELDLKRSQLCGALTGLQSWSADDLASLYADTLTALIDRHCPLSTIRSKVVEQSPWFDSECRLLRRKTRKLEKAYRRSRLQSDRSVWLLSLKSLHRLYENKSRQFWKSKTIDSRGDPRQLRRTVSALMGDSEQTTTNQTTHNAEDFAVFSSEDQFH